MNERIKIINSALTKNRGQSLRSEDLRSYQKLHVDADELDSLINNSNQLVFGRRGSGKTILLGALCDKLWNEFPKRRIVALQFFANEFLASPPPTNEWDVKQKAAAYFTVFVKILARQFGDKIEKIIESFEHQSFLGLKEHHLRDKAETLLLELWDLANIGETGILPLYTSWEKLTNYNKKNSIEASLDITGGLSMQPGNLETKAGIGGGLSTKKSKMNMEVAATKYNGLNLMLPSSVKQKIIQLIELLNLEYLIIVIDEWMALKEMQVEFAELLRRCFFGSHRIGVKIGSDPYQSRLNNGAPSESFRGIEIGADIIVALNLDRALLEGDHLIDFYKTLLYKRLNHFEPGIGEYFGTIDAEGPSNLCSSIFQDNRAFHELVLSCSGLPREFLLIFDQCSKYINCQLEQGKLTASLIREMSRRESVQNQESAIADGSIADELLFQVIKPIVVKNKSRIILVKKDDNILLSIIETLLRVRILHEYPEVRLIGEIRALYKAYIVGYGIYVDWERSIEPSLRRSSEIKEEVLPLIDFSKVKEYEIDKKTIEIIDTKQLLCPHCHELFSKSQRSFVLKQICPNCFEHID